MRIKVWTNRFVRVFRVASRHWIAHRLYPFFSKWPSVARRLLGPQISGPNRFRMAIEQIGGTFIKFGQMLAIQSDLLPLEYCKGLFSLFDRVPPFSWEEVEKIVLEDLQRKPDQIFDTFSREPIATGSIGQVHVATLGREKFAVKIRRPTIFTDFAADVTVLKFIVGLVKTLSIKSFYWIIAPTEEFIAWTQEELDFRREAHYMEELGRNACDNPFERVPGVLWSCTTARILTVDFLEGTTVSDYLRITAAGGCASQPAFAPPVFAAHLIDNFLGDAFRHGMFHADLHPGNLMILENNVVGYVDFGISGVLSRYSRRHLISMTLAYARGDLDAMCDSFFQISTFDRSADTRGFRQRLKERSVDWYGEGESENRLRKSITSIMLELLLLSRERGVWPQRDVIKYIRSAIALDGLIKTFSPTTDIGRHLERACEQNLKWESLRTLISSDVLGESLRGLTHIGRDGLLRMFALLRRAAEEDPRNRLSFQQPQQRGNSWPLHVLAAIWIAICMALVFAPGWRTFNQNANFNVTLLWVGASTLVWGVMRYTRVL